MLKCSSCGHENAENAKFCGKCGTRVEAPAPIPIPVPAPEPLPIPIPAPEPLPIPIPAPEPLPIPIPAPEPLPIPIPAPEPLPIPAPIPAPEPLPIPAPIPAPEPFPIPATVVFPAAAPAAKAPGLSGAVKALMVLVPIAIIAVVAIFVVPALTKGAPVLSKAGDISAFYSYGKVYVVNNDGSVNELDGVLQGQFKKSLDNTKAAFVVSDDGYSAGTLYYASGKGKPEKIADDVVNFVLADSGDGVAFYNNFDPNARLADLSLYDARNGETHKLDNNAYFTDSYDYYYVAAGFFAVISPDGKTVAYKADYSDGGYKTKININGKAEDLGVNIQPVAVADGAKYIYHIKTRENGEALYVSKGPAAEEIRLDRVSAYNDFHLNADYSQIVFTNYDGKSYVSANGGEKSLIAQYSVDKFLVSADIGYVRKKPEDYYNSMSISVYGLGDFRNRAFSSGGEINYIDGAFERTSVAKSVYGGAEPTITKDGKWVYYVSYGYELKKVSVTDPETAVTVAKEVYGFAVAKDGNTVYYVNYDGDLYSKKSGDDGKGTRISGDVSGYSLCVSGSGTVFFLADFWGSSGTLYTVSGTERKRVRDDVADGVVAGVSAVFYFVYEDRAYDVYRSGGGADFKKVAAADSPLVR